MKTDSQLVELLKEGDEKAFELVFNTYFDRLCLFSLNITKNKEASEEIVKDIFLRVWLNCQIDPIKVSIKKYLFQSVYNNSVKYISRLKRNTVSLDELEYSLTDNNIYEPLSPEYPIAELIAKELEDKAVEVINSLPDQCRQIYLLNRDENLKYDEIAKRLNITVGTVKTQMSRAFSKLREGLRDFLYIFF